MSRLSTPGGRWASDSRNLKVRGPFGIFTSGGTNYLLLIELVLFLVVHKVIHLLLLLTVVGHMEAI